MPSEWLRNSKRLVIIIFVAAAFLNLASALNPHSSQVDINRTLDDYTNATFEIIPDNDSSVNADLEIKPPMTEWKSYEPDYLNGSLRVETSFNASERGHYKYRWVLGGQEHPPQPLGFIISGENSTLFNYSENFTNSISEEYYNSDSCDLNNFTCYYENFQAQKILLNTEAYLHTYNTTYLNRSLNYSLSNYNTGGTLGVCDHSRGDFDCDNDASPTDNEASDGYLNVSSGTRQGTLIHSLWSLSQISSNDTVEELAVNYSRGVAENCPVWGNTTAEFSSNVEIGNASFSCGTARGQGSMMMGYWEAYMSTGNETFRIKAENLSDTNYTSPRVLRGLVTAYRATGDERYSERMENQAKELIKEQDNLSSTEFFDLGIGLFEAYEASGEYGYYRNGLSLLTRNTTNMSFSCSAISGNFTCNYPDTQSLAGLMFWKGFQSQLDIERGFSNPTFDRKPQVAENLTIDIEMKGRVTDPVMRYRDAGTWKNCTVSFFDGCSLNSTQLTNQTAYEYFFNSSRLRFPKNNGSFHVGLSAEDDELETSASLFSTTDNNRGSGQFCAVWNTGDYTCEEENYQASMILSMSESYRHTGYANFSSKLRNLVSPPYYEDVLDLGDSCRPELDDFVCNTSSIQESLTGSTRQGNLIDSLFSAFSATRGLKSYELAREYASHSPSDCDVWNNSFNCSSSRGQGSMISGYWQAYQVTSNTTYREKAMNLSRASLTLNMSNSTRLASALWRTYGYTDNKTYRDEAEAMTSAFSEKCRDNECEPKQYYLTGQMYKNAYLYGGEDFQDDYRIIVRGVTTGSDCGPGKDDYSCSDPGAQGSLSKMFRDASQALPVTLQAEEVFSVESSVIIDSSITGTCEVTNQLKNTTLENTELTLDLSTGLNTSDNLTKSVGDLNYSESASASWDIKGTELGQHDATCTVFSTSGLTEVIERTITVSSSDTGSSDDDEEDESSTGSAGGGAVGDFETKNYTVDYSTNPRIYNLNETFLRSLGINTTLREFRYSDRSCYSTRRRILENRTILNLDYICSGSSEGVIIFDRINRSNSSSLRVHEIGNLDEEVSISYGFSENLSSPMLVSYEKLEPLEMDVDYFISNGTDSELKVGVDLNRESRCAIRRDDALVYNRTLTQSVLSLDNIRNNSDVQVNCGKLNSSYTFVSSVDISDESDIEEQVPVLFLLAFLGLILTGSTLVYFRQSLFSAFYSVYRATLGPVSLWVREFYNSLLFQINLKKFRRHVSREDPVEAIKTFERLSEVGGHSASEDLLNMDIDLMRGVRLYILMDLVEDSLMEGMSIPEGGEDLEKLVNRYLAEVDNPELESLIRGKVEEVSTFSN